MIIFSPVHLSIVFIEEKEIVLFYIGMELH